ncbi:MAG: hypothetical protein CL759_06955 [Chloroflexi bacterium]|nr:hypothetical protein [Chloroflexota bacterium]|tara:strand:+ start:2178 stop:4763 length:2586 start_codon:yes stop_codon:yes gene_type:complete
MPPQTYSVVDPLGNKAGTVSAADVSKLPEGFSVATPQQEQRFAEQEKYGGLGGMAAAGALGLAHGATLGASTALLGRTGLRDDVRKLRQYNPLATVGGDIIGGIGSTLAGVGPAAFAARAAARAAASAGARGAGLAGRLAVGGAVEGTLVGAGEAAAQASLDDAINGEKVAANVLGGLVAGGVVGGALGGIGAGAKRLAGAVNRPGAKAMQDVGDAAFDGADKTLGRRISDGLADVSHHLTGKDRGSIRKGFALDAEGDAFRKAALDGDKLKPAFAERLANEIDAGDADWAKVSENVQKLRMKRDAVRPLMKDVDPVAAQNAGLAYFEDMLGEVDNMLLKKDTFKAKGLKELRKDIAYLKDEAIRGAGKINDGQERALHWFMATDGLKRRIGKLSKPANHPRSLGKSYKHAAAGEKLDTLYTSLQKGLEDTATWKAAGAVQKDLNSSLTSFLGGAKHVRKTLMTKYGTSAMNPWQDAWVANPEAINRFVNNMGLKRNALNEKALRESLVSRRNAARVMLDNFDLDDSARKSIQGVERTTDTILKTMDEAAGTIAAGNQMRDLSGANQTALLGLMAAGAGVPALALSPLLDPARTIRQLGALRKVANKFDGEIDKSVTKFFSNTVSTRSTQALSATSARIAQGAIRSKDTRVQFAERSKIVRELAEQLPKTEREMKAALAPISNGAPKAVDAATLTALRAIKYLNDTMPGGTFQIDPFGKRSVVSLIEAERWLKRAGAIDKPASLLHDLKDGKLSRDAVDAVKNVYPRMFMQMQMKVMEKLASLQAKGKTVSYAKRKQLGILLEIPTDGTLQPQVIAQVMDSYGAAKEKDAKSKKANRAPRPKSQALAAAYSTDTQRMEATA